MYNNIYKLFQKTPIQTSVDLHEENLTASDVPDICKRVLKNKVSELNLKGNPICDDGLKILVETLQEKNHSLRSLDVSDCSLTDDSARILALSGIPILFIGWNCFTVKGIEIFAKESTQLSICDLEQNVEVKNGGYLFKQVEDKLKENNEQVNKKAATIERKGMTEDQEQEVDANSQEEFGFDFC